MSVTFLTRVAQQHLLEGHVICQEVFNKAGTWGPPIQLQATTHTARPPLMVSSALFCFKSLCDHINYSFRQLLGPGSEAFAGSGQSSTMLYDFLTAHKTRGAATRWFCLHLLSQMQIGSSLPSWLCRQRWGWHHPVDVRGLTETPEMLSHTGTGLEQRRYNIGLQNTLSVNAYSSITQL